MSHLGADTEDSLETLYDKLTRKLLTEYNGQFVGPGWVKYSWNDSTWNLDDGKSSTSLVNIMIHSDGLYRI